MRGTMVDYERLWREWADANARLGRHFEDWLAIARGLDAMREQLLAETGASPSRLPRCVRTVGAQARVGQKVVRQK
jgi:hypothetical protein